MANELQFSVRYDGTQDRMLLLASFPDETEVRAWLTRRLVGNLMGQVGKLAERMVPEQIAAPEVKKEVAQFQREAAVQQANFRKGFSRGKPHPELGEEIRLVTEIRMTPKGKNGLQVRLALDNGKFVEWAIPRETFWGLMHLVERQARRAEWNLEAAPAAAPPAAEQKKQQPEPAKDKPRLN
jgi:hypothetical protein